MTTGCMLNWFYGRVINPGSVVNGLASTLWLDSGGGEHLMMS